LEKTKNCAELLRRLKENCIGYKMALKNSSATFDPRKTSQLLDEPSEQYKDFWLNSSRDNTTTTKTLVYVFPLQ
jgi:hypothetical protein